MSDQQIVEMLGRMQAQLDELLQIVRDLKSKRLAKAEARRSKTKLPPLSEAEIAAYKEMFQAFYSRWLHGEEVAVQAELEGKDADTLRRFADASNLNVTSRTPKQRCLQLIAARFREKRQLTKEHPQRAPKEETTPQPHTGDVGTHGAADA
jgi:hypothetical protein